MSCHVRDAYTSQLNHHLIYQCIPLYQLRDVQSQSNNRTAAGRYGPKGSGISMGTDPGSEGAAPKPKYMRHPGDVKKIKYVAH